MNCRFYIRYMNCNTLETWIQNNDINISIFKISKIEECVEWNCSEDFLISWNRNIPLNLKLNRHSLICMNWFCLWWTVINSSYRLALLVVSNKNLFFFRHNEKFDKLEKNWLYSDSELIKKTSFLSRLAIGKKTNFAMFNLLILFLFPFFTMKIKLQTPNVLKFTCFHYVLFMRSISFWIELKAKNRNWVFVFFSTTIHI